MKKKIVIVLLVIAFIFIASYFAYNKLNYKYDISHERNDINYCKIKDCGFTSFGTIDFKSNFDIDKVNKKLDEFNKLQSNKVKELNNYKDFSSSKCEDFKGTYNYNTGYNYSTYVYVTEKYISVDLFETKFDFCNNPYKAVDSKIYKFVYDADKDKFLSDSDILKKIGYTDKYVLDIIHSNFNSKNVTKYDLVIDNTGDIYAKFINDNGEDVERFINKKIDYIIR